MINQQIQNYTIISLLGEGGMAKVYLAEHIIQHNRVAIKVLNEEFLHDRNIRRRFIEEAKSLANLEHKNIIKVIDTYNEDDFVAFVMEYIEGPTLNEIIQKGKMADHDIEFCIKQLIAAVEYVHSNGITHRDIKPSNILIGKHGILKLVDFGIAKHAKNPDGTSTMFIMGTPSYMSPEQIRNTGTVTSQTDIYSIGVVLWEMVTGKRLYDTLQLTTPEIQTQILNQELPLTKTKWDSVIATATKKSLVDRYKNCHEMERNINPTKRSLKINSKEAVESKFNSDTIIDKANPISILKESLPLTHTIWDSTIQDATTKDPTKRSLKINSKEAVESKFNSDTIIDKANPIRAIQQQIFEHYTFLNQPGNFKLKTASIWLGILFLIYVLVYFFIYGEKSENKVSSFPDVANSEIVVPSKKMEEPILQIETPKQNPTKKEKSKEIKKEAPIVTSTDLKIGQKHQGGIIFYLDNSGGHGKVCAGRDLGDYYWEDAIQACSNLSLNGFNDWYLPSKEELKKLYQLRKAIGGFSNYYYWSSTLFSEFFPWFQDFNSGDQFSHGETYTFSVRAVRAF